MIVTAEQRAIIQRVVNVFETGRADGDYGAVTILPDGPHGQPQVTYGRSQTTEHGDGLDLSWLVEQYVRAGGPMAAELAPYVDRIAVEDLSRDAVFHARLRRAGADDVMRQLQDDLFDRAYYRPALAWCDREGLTTALSALVVYDSWIHSGGVLRSIRARFPARTPAGDGTEHEWTGGYVRARHAWLLAHPNPVVRRTVYRTAYLAALVEDGAWELSRRPFVCRRVRVA